MKKIKLLFFFVATIAATKLTAQANPYIQVLPGNSGQVQVGSILDLEITVGNTGTANIVANKLRPIVTVPSSVTFLANAQQTGLPAGWSIVTNAGSQLRICNGSDVIGGNTARTIFLKVQGVTVSAPQTFAGQMNFGGASCAVAGATPGGNNTADDFATSTIEVIPAVVPLTLVNFNAAIINCTPLLSWTTETEINTDRFEIERGNIDGTNWEKIGNVASSGYSNTTVVYNFEDKNLNSVADKVLYRLKMIDKDGRFTYSTILPVLVNCKAVSILVYPNPVQNGKLYVSLIGISGKSEATLLSTSGQLVLKSSLHNGTNELNVSAVTSGIYILQIKDEKGFNKNVKVNIKQ